MDVAFPPGDDVLVWLAAASLTRKRRKRGSVSRQNTMIEMSMTITDASATNRAAVELSGYSTNSQTFQANTPSVRYNTNIQQRKLQGKVDAYKATIIIL